MNTKILAIIIAVLLAAAFVACNNKSDVKVTKALDVELANNTDSVSLSLGYSVGANLKSQFPNATPELLAKGIVEAFAGNENPLYETPQDADMAIRTYLRKESDRIAEENLAKGKKFLEENAGKKGIQVTESGLQYKVVKKGNGSKPKAENTVRVHYHGTTIDGKVFDSSVERDDPAQFPLNGVIAGWTEGLQLMPVGSKYIFYIPSELAYGPRGAGADIGPNSALIFEVELLDIIN